MKNTLRYLAIAILAPSAAQAEWTALFDGKSLDGWTVLNGTAPYTVEDGAIVGRTVHDSPNTFLAANREYQDFVFEFEYTLDEGVNSGIQFRSISDPHIKNGRVHGYQFEMETTPRGWSGGIFDEARRGWLYPVEFNPEAKPLYRANQWNSGRIVCAGNDVRTFLNGAQVAHLVDHLVHPGIIALQVHSIGKNAPAGQTIRWRALRIKELDAAEAAAMAAAPTQAPYIRSLAANALSPAETQQGWQLLFDGSQALGFAPAPADGPLESRWSIQDGELAILPKKQGQKNVQLVTKQTYAAFELDLEFKPQPGANSGIKYYVAQYAKAANAKTALLGLEYQILDDERHPDAKAGEANNRTCASLYDLLAPSRKVGGRAVPLNIGDWNHARVVARSDGSVEHWLNGYNVLQYQRGGDDYAARLARSKFAEYPDFGLAPAGAILLQDHNDPVAFRNIRIRPLQ